MKYKRLKEKVMNVKVYEKDHAFIAKNIVYPETFADAFARLIAEVRS